ncbi:hypothetical protein V1264_003143 [Littorina saxatilis]|uniref:Prolyl 4-hydroxylase alpha subunit domain-containing protein n=2 Tax=Littorina saxatilis TaxID=31220 RepID=A0AAN9G7Z2_9CAEN
MATVEIEREDVKLPQDQAKRLAFVLYNVLTPEECEKYIKHTERKGYHQALLGIKQKLVTEFRNSDRCFVDSLEGADKLWQRIKPFIPAQWNRHQAVGLNERLRFLRYDPGHFFKPHYDGKHKRENGERSFFSLQLYLNEGFEGGSTTFLSRHDTERLERVEVVPKTGSVLIFQHDIYHEGSELIKGRKYAMRSDVMYQPLQP